MSGCDQTINTLPILAQCGRSLQPSCSQTLPAPCCLLDSQLRAVAVSRTELSNSYRVSHHRHGLTHHALSVSGQGPLLPLCLPASQHAYVSPANAGRPVQEDSIRTDDLLERIQDSGRFSRHSIAGSEPSSAELPNGQLAPQASWALRRRSADQSASSLKRAREAVQSQPLALRLDVLAGPTMDQAGFQSQVGVSEVRLPCAEQGSGGGG